MLVSQVDAYRFRVSWFALYAAYVYWGYSLADGRKIPSIPWAQLAIDENPVLDIFADFLKKKLSQ
jgi:hypothetical protein